MSKRLETLIRTKLGGARMTLPADREFAKAVGTQGVPLETAIKARMAQTDTRDPGIRRGFESRLRGIVKEAEQEAGISLGDKSERPRCGRCKEPMKKMSISHFYPGDTGLCLGCKQCDMMGDGLRNDKLMRTVA